MIFSEDRVKGPYSETDAKKIFADAGLDWETRKERYETIDFIPSKIKKEKLNKIVIPQTLQIKVNKEIPFRERYETIDF